MTTVTFAPTATTTKISATYLVDFSNGQFDSNRTAWDSKNQKNRFVRLDRVEVSLTASVFGGETVDHGDHMITEVRGVFLSEAGEPTGEASWDDLLLVDFPTAIDPFFEFLGAQKKELFAQL